MRGREVELFVSAGQGRRRRRLRAADRRCAQGRCDAVRAAGRSRSRLGDRRSRSGQRRCAVIEYEPGSWGPRAATDLDRRALRLARPGRDAQRLDAAPAWTRILGNRKPSAGTRRQPAHSSASRLVVLRAERRHALPEPLRMVHVQRVRELVDQQVAHHLGPLEQQAAVEADRAAHRAASPAAALAAHHQLRIPQARTPARHRRASAQAFRSLSSSANGAMPAAWREHRRHSPKCPARPARRRGRAGGQRRQTDARASSRHRR